MLRHALPFLVAGLLCSGTWIASAASASDVVGAGQNWSTHGGDANESGYSRLDGISASNIAQLGLASSLDLPGEVTLEATPLAVDGVLYFTGSYGAVYAVEAASGKLLWKYDPEMWKHNPFKMDYGFAANRGVAYADGRIFSAVLDSRLFALDAKTGKLIWSVETTDLHSMQTITGAPRTFKGKVIIGNAGADFGARGYVTAYDQATGKQAWRFYVVPGSPEENKGDPAMEKAAKTWSGEYWKTGTGGAVWDSITFDPELNRIYLGTGNAGPYDADKRSPGNGDNLYTASIVAVDADTGKYVWHYQVVPRDAWDYDCTQRMTLADLTIDGKPRKVLMQAPKDGFFYVLDRKTGKLISAEKFAKATWADHIDLKTGRPVETKGVRYYQSGETFIWPTPTGAHSWQDMSFSPKAGLVYIPTMQIGAHFFKGPAHEGEVEVAGITLGTARSDAMDGKGALVAWDPVQQKERWKVQQDTIWNGGTLATAGNLVFEGAGDGYFSAYDATTGQRLWQFNAGLGINAAPIAYSVGGKEYVSVLVGYGGTSAISSDYMNVGWKFGAQPRRLLTFSLDGKAVLPPSAPRDMTVHPVDDPSIKITEADAAAGHAMFLACAVCHGKDAVAAGAPGPDLRESQIALNPDNLWSVVHDGVLLQNGMPKFESLTHDQVMDIFAYIRSRAREALGAKKAEAKPAAPGGKL